MLNLSSVLPLVCITPPKYSKITEFFVMLQVGIFRQLVHCEASCPKLFNVKKEKSKMRTESNVFFIAIKSLISESCFYEYNSHIIIGLLAAFGSGKIFTEWPLSYVSEELFKTNCTIVNESVFKMKVITAGFFS